MNFEIKFIPEAEETFDALISQLRQRWGDKYVFRLEERILKTLETISINPYLYPIAEESTEIRKGILHKNCSLLYKIDGKYHFSCLFLDNRQDPMLV